MPTPTQTTIVDRDQPLSLAVASPCRQFLAIEKVAWAAPSVKDYQSPIVFPILQDVIDQRPQRGQANATSDHDDVPPSRGRYRPACAERTSYTHVVAHSPIHKRMSRLSDRTHRVDQAIVQRRVAADRNGQLANSKHPQHAELSRLK